MIDQNTTPAAEAVKRVAKAIGRGRATGSATGLYVRIPWGELDDVANAVIAAHTAYLWQRAMQPDVVEAVALTEYGTRDGFYEERPAVRERYLQPAREQIYAALTLLLGPRPEGDTDAN